MKYRTRVHEVEAVQWTAHNFDEVRSLCPEAYTCDEGWTLVIPMLGPEDVRRMPAQTQQAAVTVVRIPGAPRQLHAYVGYYVVRVSGGLCVPMRPTEFTSTYEPA